jgi:hypothetical protein
LAPVIDEKACVDILVGKEQMKIWIPLKSLVVNKPVLVQFPGGSQVSITLKDDDDLYNYARQYLHWFSILAVFKDAIAEGNIFMINILLKMMIPCFYAHSALSKYFVECIDFILKTEHLLEPQLALQVRASSLVNPLGRKGHNKAADMQKENQVKELKKLIKGLGANKTENSIIQISKAAPIINEITSTFDEKIGHKPIKSSHSHKPQVDELQSILKTLHSAKPFTCSPGRRLLTYRGIKKSVSVKKTCFKHDIMTVVNRLKRDLPVDYDHVNDSDNEDD